MNTILKRLPVKTLLRFKSASKPCHPLISTPLFVKHHFRYQSQTPKQQDPTMMTLLVKEGESPSLDDVPFKFLGSCNGLIFGFRNPYGILWNPVTRQCIDSIEWPDSHRFSLTYHCISGLVHHDSDYKAILAYSFPVRSSKATYPVDECYRSVAFVLSMKSRIWIRVGCPYIIHEGGNAVALNGRLHWALNTCRGYYSSIIYFDMSDFKFKELILPHYEPHFYERVLERIELGSYRGKLCFYRFGGCDKKNFTCTIWVMNEYGVEKSWAKLAVAPELTLMHYFRPFCIIPRNDKLVLIGKNDYGIEWDDIQIVSVDCEEENSDPKITLVARKWMVEPIQCFAYTPSLLWIDTPSSDREGLPPPVALVPLEEFISKTGSIAHFSVNVSHMGM